MPKKPDSDNNPNAFKLWINHKLVLKMAQALQQTYPDFDKNKFILVSRELDPLELKPRVLLIRDQLYSQLPKDYKKALKILLETLHTETLSGFDLWPYTEYIQTYGLDSPELSLKALRQITTRFTGEFAVRPFLKKYPEQTLSFLATCAQDKNVHVRRWASEGSRPRLPWGERLHEFVKDPRPTLAILENLKYDPELYVRKSVANHLNDIAKDHPEVVAETLKKWQKAAPLEHQKNIDWILRHALRTLIKQGHPKALSLIGADRDAKVKVGNLKLAKTRLRMNQKLEFSFFIQSQAKKPQKLVVDYIIHHMKSNQETSAKVFKLKSFTLAAGEKIEIKKNHSIKPITTRRYYPGVHILEIQVNGRVYARSKWQLQL